MYFRNNGLPIAYSGNRASKQTNQIEV